METIVCIPSSIQSHSELRDSILQLTDGDFILIGETLTNTKDKCHVKCELYNKDELMREAFEASSQDRVSEEDLLKIETHESVIYLIFDNSNLDNLHLLHKFIKVCLHIGGLGVKFENSGLSHSKDVWLSYNFHEDTLQLLNSHAMYIKDDLFLSSVGMHIFGLPDVSVSIDPEMGIFLLTDFNHYHLFESPTFKEGHTFSPDEESPKYEVVFKSDFVYEGEDCFENPYGRILLDLSSV